MKTRSIYLDTEFSEGFFKPISWLPSWLPGNKPRWSIELISIGLVDDEGKEYYAINKHFKESRCNDWVKENVLTKLPSRLLCDDTSWWSSYDGFECEECGLIPNPLYKSISEIRDDIINFVAPASAVYAHCETSGEQDNCLENYLKENPVKFKAYFADYDWVMFCTIFGTMMDLPDGFPMYCFDLKQEFDNVAELVHEVREEENNHKGIISLVDEYPLTMDGTKTYMKESDSYPKQSDSNEHNALNDAIWNLQLDKWLTHQRNFL